LKNERTIIDICWSVSEGEKYKATFFFISKSKSREFIKLVQEIDPKIKVNSQRTKEEIL